MVATPTKSIGLGEFLALPETEPASEYLSGNIVRKPMPQGKHSILQTKLAMLINSKLLASGVATAFTELRCTFAGGSIVPDLSVIQQARIPEDDNGEVANAFNFPPDWLIEILSPGQSSTLVVKKILHCLSCGTELGWLIDPAEKSIFIYHSQNQIESIENLAQKLRVPTFAEAVNLTGQDVFELLKKN
jgi:Uma2 family endonuclease